MEKVWTLENEYITAGVMPGRGGKVCSIRDKDTGFELLYQSERGYPPLSPGMDFSGADASGMDDVFPSMGEVYAGPITDTVYFLPDHGEIWTSAMETAEADKSHISMRTQGVLLPYEYHKTVSLKGRRVEAAVRIVNRGEEPLPLVWVSHGLWHLEADTRFVFPRDGKYIEHLGGGYPEEEGGMASIDNPRYRFHEPVPQGKAMKFYFAEPVKEGRCAAVYPGAGIKAEMTFDPEKLPYLGFWITNGGYRGDKNFAFEPATAYFDTWQRAFANGRLPRIEPGGEVRLELGIGLSPTTDGK